MTARPTTWFPLVLALLLARATHVPAEPTPVPPTAPATQAASLPRAEVDRFVRPLVDGQWCTGVVVGVVTPDGSTVYGYGRASEQDGHAPGGDTVYEIGSVSKVFTSLLLARAVQDGRVALDDPVQKFLPDGVTLPRGGKDRDKPITLAHLATHTSGLPRLPDNFTPKDPANPYADYSVEQMYAFLSRCRLSHDPGETYDYSNLAVGLLGHVLAREAGRTYEELLTVRITRPLGMNDTRITLTDDMRRRLAPGHDPDGNPVPNWDIPTLAGAGAIRSTADDLLKFLSAQLGLKGAGAGAAAEDVAEAIRLTHLRRAAAGPGTGIALGWHIDTALGLTWHNGQTGGYHSFVGFSPAHRAGVVVLSNTATGTIDAVGFALLRRMTGRAEEPLILPPVVTVEPKVLDEYVGRYFLAGGLAVVTITRDGDRLYAQLTGQPRFRIYPQSETEFYWRVVEARAEFVRGGDGRVGRLTLRQDGRDMTAWRLRPEESEKGEKEGQP